MVLAQLRQRSWLGTVFFIALFVSSDSVRIYQNSLVRLILPTLGVRYIFFPWAGPGSPKFLESKGLTDGSLPMPPLGATAAPISLASHQVGFLLNYNGSS